MLLDIVARTDSSEGGGVQCSKDEFFFNVRSYTIRVAMCLAQDDGKYMRV